MFVNKRVKWPQEYVLSGAKKERISYDSLTMGQWVTGFCRSMQEESDGIQKNSMIDYLIALLEDANDFSWQAAKASHTVLLCRMEQGEITDYTQVDRIDRIRRAHAQRHVVATGATGTFKKSAQKSMPCQYYNMGTCSHQNSHDNKNMSYKHVCSNCFKKTGKSFTHPEIEYRKARVTKND